jgi:AraC-like DNA-binding protein
MDRPAATSVVYDGACSGRALLVDPLAGGLLPAPSKAPVEKALQASHAEILWRTPAPESPRVEPAPGPIPAPPDEWTRSLQQLVELSRTPAPVPSWWTPTTPFFGGVETCTGQSFYEWEDLRRAAPKDSPVFFIQLTLAGCGQLQLDGEKSQRLTPGKALFGVVPSRHKGGLPADSAGWTFGWIGIAHPYLVSRIAKMVALSGPLFDVSPDGALAAGFVRLLRGAIAKDFRDQFDVELALFDFVLTCERWAHDVRNVTSAGQQLLDEVRSRIVANLPKAIGVETLAADYGMSRSHFSHYFHSRTGLTPAHFATEVRIREATRMLLDSRVPLKSIADACGFANANHFCKVFRRFQHLSPGAYRQAMQ